MNNYLNAFIRSVIESITEFLPVSSTGHLFLFSAYFPFQGLGEYSNSFEDLFDIYIQSGAIFSVLVLYFRHLFQESKTAGMFILGKTEDKQGILFVVSIMVGCLPIMAIGFLFKDILDSIKSNSNLLLILSLSWIVGGILILLVERKLTAKEEVHSNHNVSVKQAFFIGIFQCIALIPGISRSAATIIAGRSLGLSKKLSAEFSFFLAIPVLLAAGFYKLYKHRSLLQGEFLPILIFGSLLSFLFCFAVIRWFLIYIKKHNFQVFGYYRIALGMTVMAAYFFKS
ncbi:MAG: undecaprenyl-diphosphate phosphatase [Leptospiraceae bacterium]|nr:undecaprenyl-diphosphate phosphatase [Leptospiraceae bacterium]MCK6381299.1 undecaprenyl-diphosphate phosphatase [Leptospiraceae bacterium]NUM40916.1 undecaprenyl-diphosphate phosphatase [Leptospiraceae bacterium]